MSTGHGWMIAERELLSGATMLEVFGTCAEVDDKVTELQAQGWAISGETTKPKRGIKEVRLTRREEGPDGKS